MKRLSFNRQLWAFGIAAASSSLVGVWGLLRARRSQRSRAAWSSKRVVVMGGSRGLGFPLAREFARRGASVVITARDDEELVHARQSILRRWGTIPNQVNAIRCDVRDSAVTHLIDRAALNYGEFGPPAIDE